MTTATKKLLLFILLLAFAQFVQAQVKVGDNPTVINKGAILELESSNKGLLFPRVNLINTTTWSLAASSTPAAGMMVYNTKTISAGFTGNVDYPAITGDGTGIYYWEVVADVFNVEFDLLILDINMPGSELIEDFVSKAIKYTKVIIFSNIDKDDPRVENLIKIGADAFLPKTSQQADVISTLEFIFNDRHL